ncbi:sensor histidine kinase [Microvirga tunisiensis]|uniref:histidine kinase n=1 Tax=Microvirga tunisiensis TaxID=2108360 RepID=A0A5N7MP89_9HYPH|nr:HAMP domain-containing sensor histidine kinase [Microvirga tunisiensis]MPR10653.1 HAMP domain-containing histidine kinase [Microvirga tunisiensis]MPR28841.1 HAMP domain-containing histidine kinase [Microvirga tunisiensis]
MAALCTLRMKRLVNLWNAAAVILLVSMGGSAAQPKSGEPAAQPKTILFIDSFGPNFQQGILWSREIQNELNRQSPWSLDIQEHALVTARNGDEAAEAKFVEYLRVLYAQRPPDLIVTMGGPAARFIQRHRADLYPTTPMLLAAVEVRLVDPSMLSEQDAVTAVRFDQVAPVDNILRLLPKTKVIAFILGNSPGERFWTGEQQRILGPLLANKVELIFCNERPFEEILKEVARLPPNSAIFFQQMAVDGAGAVYGDKEPLKRISEVANAPIFTFDESYFTGEVVGGPMFSPAEGARPTAAVAVRILEGEKASGIKVPPIGFSMPKYDWRQLQRWNTSESRLPPGSEILFREPTAWERYTWQITLALAVLLVQAGLISVLLLEHRRRRLAEVQSRQRMTELAHVNRFSTAGELSASIAHEINQPLGSILANAEAAQAILKSPKPDVVEVSEILDDILSDDQRAAEVIRRLRSLLKKAPFELKNLDLNDLARETVGFLSGVAVGRKVELISEITSEPLPILGDRVQLQQVILNLVMNGIDAMRDTPAENRIISIQSSRAGNFAELSVSDHGPGIPEDNLNEIFEPFFTSKAEGMGMGMGLSIARTIIEAHDGQIWAENRDYGGASFRIRLPLIR